MAATTIPGVTGIGSLWMVSPGCVARRATAASSEAVGFGRPISANVTGSPTAMENRRTSWTMAFGCYSSINWVSRPKATFSPCM